MQSSKAWGAYYRNEQGVKPLVPESFVARIFLSQEPVRLLKAYNFRGSRILDLGCGNGRHLAFFSQLGFEIAGTEVSGQKVDELRMRFTGAVIVKSTSDRLAFADESFDYVCSVNAIYYLESSESSLEANLAEAARLLKPGGCLICSYLGGEHFVLRNAQRADNGTAVIGGDPLKFRNGSRVRPVWNRDELYDIYPHADRSLTIHTIGEIRDECGGFTRHLYYVVAYKAP